MLTNKQNCIDSKFVASATQSLGNGGIDRETKLTRSVRALVAFRSLVDVEGNDLNVGTMPVALVGIADQKAVSEVLGMRQIAVDSGDDG